MTVPAEQFPFVPRDPALGAASLAPMLTASRRSSYTAWGFAPFLEGVRWIAPSFSACCGNDRFSHSVSS
jgi:hypothetical protein